MIKYTDKGTVRQHLTDRLMESALNNVGFRVNADKVFRDIAENRLPVWIDELQTYDVQEVRQGRWIDTGSGQECSVCGEIQYGYDSGRYYCPNCGAKMGTHETKHKK